VLDFRLEKAILPLQALQSQNSTFIVKSKHPIFELDLYTYPKTYSIVKSNKYSSSLTYLDLLFLYIICIYYRLLLLFSFVLKSNKSNENPLLSFEESKNATT
jgi:hypothetical protein